MNRNNRLFHTNQEFFQNIRDNHKFKLVLFLIKDYVYCDKTLAILFGE